MRWGVLYVLTDEGCRAGGEMLRVHGDAWLDKANPACEEGSYPLTTRHTAAHEAPVTHRGTL